MAVGCSCLKEHITHILTSKEWQHAGLTKPRNAKRFISVTSIIMNCFERIVWLGVILRRIRDFRYGVGWGAFHGDAIYRKLMIDLSDAFQFTSFVETGTFRGYSTEFMALHKPQLSIFTIEAEPCSYNLAKRALRKYPNITQHLGNSGDWISARFC